MKRLAVSLFVASLLPVAAVPMMGQTALSPTDQLFIQVDKAFAGTATVSSAALSGEVQTYAGSKESSGQITLTANADGSSSVVMQLDSGERSETQDTFANGQGCTWTASDGVTQTTAGLNCLIPVAWFLPEVSLFSTQQPSSNGTLSTETDAEKAPVLHWKMSPVPGLSAEMLNSLPSLGEYDLHINSVSDLPSSLSYSLHPDDNAADGIPVSVVFSDYRLVDGTEIPFHIQRYMNGTLSLDITLSNAVIAY
jgi:hypothetical protein